jgi:putative addiction module component (TIGR02574 family)
VRRMDLVIFCLKVLRSESQKSGRIFSRTESCHCREFIYECEDMVALSEIEQQALKLTEDERAVLAAHLLDSLPAILHDDDGGVEEAARRDAELDEDPSKGMTMDEFKSAFGR